MNAIEFEAEVHDGTLELPSAYREIVPAAAGENSPSAVLTP